MISIQSYMRQGQHRLRRWLVDPRIHTTLRGALYFSAGFVLSAASLGQRMLPLALSMVCACGGWSAVLTTLGGLLGYGLFWSVNSQPAVWLLTGLAVALLLGERRISRDNPLLLPAIAGLIVASSGVLFQMLGKEDTPVALYVIRVFLASSGAWLFTQVRRGRNPLLEWLTCGLAVLALAQIAPLGWLSFGFLAAGALAVSRAFPAAAIAGLALDLAQVTPVPMTAVLVLAYLVRLLPKPAGVLGRIAPVFTDVLVMWLCDMWDLTPLPALAIGSILGGFLPEAGKIAHRRGETGVAQVRLEMAAGVLAQSQQLLVEAPAVPVDEDALVARAAERACRTSSS